MSDYMRAYLIRWCLGLLSIACVPAQAGPILNEDIKLLKFEPLTYPVAAKVKWVEGTVVVRVELRKSGEVARAVAISNVAVITVGKPVVTHGAR